MLRLQPFKVFFPKDLSAALALMKEFGPLAKICAGGTDLLPNMKHELHEPGALVHLGQLSGLDEIEESGDGFAIGAMTKLDSLINHSSLAEHFPSLIEASQSIASPQIRNMGTIGGNLCLDTRCLFYNQSYFWREAIGFCLKKCGDTCHVTKTGKRCVAASSNDTATVLMTLGATLEICCVEGIRNLSIEDFFVANGEKNNALLPHEVLTRVFLPKRSPTIKSFYGFSKLRNRAAIDFPLLSIAVRFDLSTRMVIEDAKMSVNALAAKPKLIDFSLLRGRVLSAELANEVGELARKKCIPLINICDDHEWRRDMVEVYAKRAVLQAIERLVV